MQLDKLDLELRTRNGNEAIDLGISFVRKHWLAIYTPWLIVIISVALILKLSFKEQPSVALMIFWWSLPIFERLCYHIMSHLLFQNPVSTWKAIKSLPSQWKCGLISQLTIWRLSSNRCVHTPIYQLEHSGDDAKGKVRHKLIGTAVSQYSTPWSMVFSMFEILFIFVIYWFLDFFHILGLIFGEDTLFKHLGETIFRGIEPSLAWQSLLFWIQVSSIALMRPFYLGAGFILYINRRVILEGWDIELRFRTMASRLSKCLPLLLILLAYPAHNNYAADTDIVRQDFIEILNSPEFDPFVERTIFTPSEQKKRDKNYSENDFDLGSFISYFIKFLGIAAIALVLFYFIHQFKGIKIPFSSLDRASKKSKLKTIAGFDIEELQNPLDLSKLCSNAAKSGETRLALSLLMRSNLSFMIQHNLPLSENCTERECLKILKNSSLNQKFKNFYESVNSSWINLAYAHRDISQSELDHFIQLNSETVLSSYNKKEDKA